jgi:hypothetical protein
VHCQELERAKGDNYSAEDIYLGRAGKYELFVNHKCPGKYAEFVLFVLAAATESPTSTGGGGAGGGGAGGGGGGVGAKAFSFGSAQPLLTIPVAPQ